MDRLIECVPNFSEGRDQRKVDRIAGAIENAHPGVSLLSVEPDVDYNRCVMTFVGSAEAVLAGAFAGAKQAREEIDMRSHRGEHPRIGATDVIPFVPLGSTAMEECVGLAHTLGGRIGKELGIPVYYYAKAARFPERELLSNIREGQYEGLRDKLTRPEWKPDEGPSRFTPSVARTGASVVGARTFLIAFNVNLSSDDLAAAKRIAGIIRTSGRKVTDETGGGTVVPGSLRAVQALGVTVEKHGIVQVSMNLLDFKATGIHTAMEAVRSEADRLGVGVSGSEIVGLVPLDALLDAGRHYHGRRGSESALVDAAIEGLGLNDLSIFDPERKVIDYVIRKRAAGALARQRRQDNVR